MSLEKSNSLNSFLTWIETKAQAGFEFASNKMENLKERIQNSVDGLFETLASYKIFEGLDLAPWTKIKLDDTDLEANPLETEGPEDLEPNDEDLAESVDLSDEGFEAEEVFV